MLQARSAANLGVRDQRGRFPFPILFGSTVAHSVASQSKFSLPRVSGFTATDSNVDTVWPGGSEESMVGTLTQATQPMGVFIAESRGRCAFGCVVTEIEDEGIQRVDSFELSRECCPNPLPSSKQREIG